LKYKQIKAALFLIFFENSSVQKRVAIKMPLSKKSGIEEDIGKRNLL
jgi:hypothetical protein